MRIGDKVRFVNEVGGGTVSGFDGKDIVLVRDEDGFDIPMLKREVVVIDEGKEVKVKPEPEPAEPPVTFHKKPLERRGGDLLNAYLGFIPWGTDGDTFRAYLVNDSNYYLQALLLSFDNASCLCRFLVTLEPNTKQMVEEFHRAELVGMERLRVQMLVYKTEKPFLPQQPFSVDLRLDTVKFYRPNTFTQTPFFKAPALLVELVRNGKPQGRGNQG
ncbi:MAG: DUF2027 domain-containing protein [Prevotellaceae bacterium]|nr:DUF2027 domain-containing protein [Prevotellaceae bacterium]